MKLTIEHLVPYLPYGLKVRYENGIHVLDSLEKGGWSCEIRQAMRIQKVQLQSVNPLLIPISALIPELELWLRELRSLNEEIPGSLYIPDDCKELPYFICQKVFELHGDMFGLIDAGLAINKLTYKEA